MVGYILPQSKLYSLKYFENLDETQAPKLKSEYKSDAKSDTTYTMRHTYQESGYQCRATTEKSNQNPNVAFGKFVRLVKTQTENNSLKHYF